jgi:hypothetical protein
VQCLTLGIHHSQHSITYIRVGVEFLEDKAPDVGLRHILRPFCPSSAVLVKILGEQSLAAREGAGDASKESRKGDKKLGHLSQSARTRYGQEGGELVRKVVS